MRYSYSISKLSLPFASIGPWTQEPHISSEVFLSAATVRNSLLIITTSSGWMECKEAGSKQPPSQPICPPSSAHCKEKEPNPPPTDSERSVCRLEDFHRPQRPAPSSPPLQFWTQVSRDKLCSSRRPYWWVWNQLSSRIVITNTKPRYTEIYCQCLKTTLSRGIGIILSSEVQSKMTTKSLVPLYHGAKPNLSSRDLCVDWSVSTTARSYSPERYMPLRQRAKMWKASLSII